MVQGSGMIPSQVYVPGSGCRDQEFKAYAFYLIPTSQHLKRPVPYLASWSERSAVIKRRTWLSRIPTPES